MSKPGLPEHLVRPGGSFSSELALVLHYPSYTSRQINDALVFDPTNPSITRLSSSGFNARNALWLDRYSRRRMTSVKKGVRFNPSEHIDPAPLQYHHNWLDLCLRTSAAKVLAIFGSENKEYFTKKWGQRLEELRLWGAYQDSSLWILHPEGDNTRVERLVLFLWHPEYVTNSELASFLISTPGACLSTDAVFEEQSIEIGRRYDLVMGLAAQLAGITRSSGQISYNETDCTNDGSLKRAAEDEDGEAKFAIIKRRKVGKNKDLATGDASLQVVCRSCGYPRLDVEPLFHDADDTRGRRYQSPYTRCPDCDKDRQFIPVDGSPFVTQDDLKRNNKSDNIQRRTNKARKVQAPVGSTESKTV